MKLAVLVVLAALALGTGVALLPAPAPLADRAHGAVALSITGFG